MNRMVCISKSKIVLLAMVVLAMPVMAHAQSGCTDSPENSTVVLALVGSAGAFFTTARRLIKARRKSTEK